MSAPLADRRGERRVFSPRLESFLNQLAEGETPNAGSFCSFCYNPLPPGMEQCDHCGQSALGRAAITSLPGAVIEMHRRLRRRESLIVNAFAYLGLALALALFLGLVTVNVLSMAGELWFFIVATAVLLVASRLFPALLGGVIGDEVAFRYARKRLAQEWTQHLTERERANGREADGAGP